MNILESRFYVIIDRLSNLFILNVFWIVSCIPIITIAPATSAMFSVVRQWKIKEDTSVVRNYFRYFKENFKDSFFIGIVWTTFAVVLYFNYFYLNQDQTTGKYVIVIPLFIISLLFVGTSAYVFPLITHYKVSWKGAIKHSFFVAIASFPTTLVILSISALIIVTLIYLPATSLIIFSIGAYINFSLCYRVFQKMDQTAK